MRVGQVSNLITQKVESMTEAEDRRELYFKRKPITALFLYVVCLERGGQPGMLDMLLHAIRASRVLGFIWVYVERFTFLLPSKASPRGILLASPHIHRGKVTSIGYFIQWWAPAASVVPRTEEVAQSVVDELLWLMSLEELSPHITAGVLSWLTMRPSLPPVCLGRYYGTSLQVVKVARGLKDIEALKSYLLTAWSEWSILPDFGFWEMCDSIREDFYGIGMTHHQADLIQRLDHVLGQLDRGLTYLNQHNPDLSEGSVRDMKCKYQQLKETLLEVNAEAVARTSSYPIATLFCMLIQSDIHRISRSSNIHVRASSPMSITSWSLKPVRPPPPRRLINEWNTTRS